MKGNIITYVLKDPDGSKEYTIVAKLKKMRAKPNLVTFSFKNINKKRARP